MVDQFNGCFNPTSFSLGRAEWVCEGDGGGGYVRVGQVRGWMVGWVCKGGAGEGVGEGGWWGWVCKVGVGM